MNSIQKTTLLSTGCLLIAGCASLPFLGEPDPRWADYKSWTRITESAPHTGMSQALGGMHRGPEGFREVYVNDIGRSMLTSDGPYDFPEGTVLVKEQYASEADWEKGKNASHTVSLKVADNPGTEASDWNWAIGFTGKVQPTIEDPNCVACHTAANALNKSDYVFSVPAYIEAN